ncbi:MAG: endopeptidase La [Actinomycetota bacterium]|nr:endopeptidase La [Actinomycetota bacterium]
MADAGSGEAVPVLEVVEAGQEDDAIRAHQELPDAMPVLPLRDTVAYPDTLSPLGVGQERSIKLVDDVLAGNRMLVMVASRDPEEDTPSPDQLHDVGVVGVVTRMLKVPDGTIRILVQGSQRVKLGPYVAEKPYLVSRIAEMPDVVEETPELEALTRNVQRTFSDIIEQIPYLPEELQMAVANVDDPSALSHLIAGALRIPTDEKQQLLEEVDVAKRLRALSGILARELEVIQLGSQIQSEVQSSIDKGQREYFLREQLKAIQAELGEEDEHQAEVNELRERLEEAQLPETVLQAAERELSRLEKLPPAAAEHGVIRTYLEWLVELPWAKETEDNLDIEHAREVLDTDHYDMEKIKDRILEYLAVRKLNPDSPGPILCFAGPPGVGKTSLGKSIARALGREFERISVGGVRDEAEIRGHRRTYIGAMPGTIIRALRDAGSRNPVFMIDEIDKMGSDFRGDPSSAMLEVLDPSQNDTFRDHYLDVPFDLSDVMFIATANVLDTIPGPLRDRMEVINLAGYTVDEKRHIARRYLVPRQIKANGLTGSQISFTDPALTAIIEEYTREAGVRNLEREIGTVCRKVARVVAEGSGNGKQLKVSGKKVRELLGRRRVFSETRRRTKVPGVSTGLAWTPTGGDVLFIEATAMAGNGKLVITGQLGDVMRESAQAAVSYVRANASRLAPDLDEKWFASHDIHIHVPAGAVPKDGPSAGVAMTVALVSLITGRPVRNDVAMTGEVTLTGQVLPIGGVKEKSLAAQRAGIKLVILPNRNEGDVEEIPEHERTGIRFVYADKVSDALDAALEGAR